MDLSNLPKTTTKSKKRIGRGYGSGKGGHTVGKGQKGQKTRAGGTTKLLYSGTKSNKDFFRQTPWLRGKKRLKSHQAETYLIKSSQLSVFKAGDIVSLEALVKAKLISVKDSAKFPVKIVFDTDPQVKLDIQVPATKSVLQACK